MNLVRTIAILAAAATAGEARLNENERALEAVGPAVDGECPFGDDYFDVLNAGPTICDGIDLMVGFVLAFPQTNAAFPPSAFPLGGGFVHRAFWDKGNKDDTLYCIKAQGYSYEFKVLSEEDGLYFFEDRGHVAYIFTDGDVNSDPKSDLQIPGAYYMKGGVIQAEFDFNTDATNVVKAKGQFVDICAEIGALKESI